MSRPDGPPASPDAPTAPPPSGPFAETDAHPVPVLADPVTDPATDPVTDPVTDPPVAPPRRRSRWHRTRRACAALAVAGVLAAAGGIAVAVRTAQLAGTPEAAVRSYFAAVARGDARTALAAGAVPAGGRALVSDDVLAATLDLAPLDDVRTGAVTRVGDTATVAVRYRIGGAAPRQVDDRVDVVRLDGRWRLRESAVPVELTVQDAASWAAVPASTPFVVPSGTQLAFPGAVPVVFRADRLQPLSAADVVRFAATDDGVRVTAALSTRGRAEVAALVQEALRRCAAGGTDVDPFCPQPTPGRDDDVTLRSVPTSFRGTLQDTDQLDLDLAVTPETAGTIAVSGSVRADGRWQVLDYDNVARQRDGETTIDFAGTVPVGTGALAWERS